MYYNERYGFWALSRFSDVLAASLDTETFSSARGITLDTIGEPHPVPDHDHDGPTDCTTPSARWSTGPTRRGGSLRSRAASRSCAREYLDPFVGEAGFDFVQDFGMRLPVMVISTLLGFPEEDHDQLREWSDLSLHREEGKEGMTPEAQEAMNLTIAYYISQIEQRRREPSDDMITAMLEADMTLPDGEVRKLDDLEVMGMMALISNAGNETVARMLGWAALVLDEYPDARREMAENLDLVPTGIEELLRYEAPSPIQGRYVTRDVEMHGTVIPEGRRSPCYRICRARRAQVRQPRHLRPPPGSGPPRDLGLRRPLLPGRRPGPDGGQGGARPRCSAGSPPGRSIARASPTWRPTPCGGPRRCRSASEGCPEGTTASLVGTVHGWGRAKRRSLRR